MGPIQKEGTVLVVGDKPERFVGQAIGQVFAVCPFRQGGYFIGRKVARRLSLFCAGYIYVKSLFVGIVRIGSQMPFADAGRGVAGLLQEFGDGHLSQRQLVIERRDQ